MSESSRIELDTYAVEIGDSWERLDAFLHDHFPGAAFFILVDEHTEPHCLPILDVQGVKAIRDAEVLQIDAGEQSKSPEIAVSLWQALLELQADRQAVIINLGGGVVSDLGGFVAATYKRGVACVNLPTSLLSMIDASVGGKTGINLSGYKNQVGTFTDPAAVFIFPKFLETLPERELRSGWAELIKHEALREGGKPLDLPLPYILTEDEWVARIEQSVRFKASVVGADFRELGERKVLNFGHTIGHALESLAQHWAPGSMLHGEAIAAGMLMELHLSVQVVEFPEEQCTAFGRYVTQLFGKVTVPSAEKMHQAMLADKKNIDGTIQFVLLEQFGKPVYNQTVTEEAIQEAIAYYQSFSIA